MSPHISTKSLVTHAQRAVLSLAVRATAPALAADTDADFAKKAASGGALEVELGRLATQHADDQAVRAFGQQMVTDHGKANQSLQEVARREGISLPAGMRESDRATLEKFSKLRGRDFDQAYIDLMVEDHQTVVEAFRAQAKEGTTELDRWAATTLPTLETHLEHARTIKADVAGGSTRASAGGSTRREPSPR
jgi:putative membrane protein